MNWIYLSPHFDDAVYSCGGLIWMQSRSGERVSVWTICGGEPPQTGLSPFAASLHARWQASVQEGGLPAAGFDRLEEDKLACRILGVPYRHLPWQDCVYRYSQEDGLSRPVIGGEEDLWEAPPEPTLIQELVHVLRRDAPDNTCLVCPMALGNHIDHRLVRTAAELSGLPVYYYADYPYVVRMDTHLEAGPWRKVAAPISLEGLNAWQKAATAHQSQASTFWKTQDELLVAFQNFWGGGGGRLFLPGESLEWIDNG